MRTVILHYHFFKNAGTSVDDILIRNFGMRWVTAEFPGGVNSELVARWIEQEATAVAFSSHTAELPLPRLAEVKIIPIVMLRHPIDRIRSAYQFERKQKSETLGAKIAKTTDLAGYIRARLDMTSDRQCRNFHASRLSRMTAGQPGGEFEAAAGAIRTLPFVGVVEAFDQSMDTLRELLAPDFPQFKVASIRKNITADDRVSLTERLDVMRREIGDALWEELNAANQSDLRLHHLACVRLLGEGGLPDAPPPLTSVAPEIRLPPSSPAGPHDDVEELLKRGQRDDARQRLRAIVESLPSPLPVADVRRLAPLFFRAEAAQDVVSFIAALSDTEKASDAVQMTLARALNLAGHPGEAETAYRRILAQKPEHAAAHHMLGLLLFQLDRLADALPHLKRAAERERENYQVLVRLALAAAASGETDLARQAMDKAAAVADDAHRHLAWRKRFESLSTGQGQLAASGGGV